MRLFTLTLALSAAKAAEMRTWLRARLRENQVPQSASDEIVLGAEEAFALALRHCSRECETVLRVSMLDDDLYLTISDNGLGPNPSAQRGNRLGLALLRRLMDEVQLQASDDGVVVRLVKRHVMKQTAAA